MLMKFVCKIQTNIHGGLEVKYMYLTYFRTSKLHVFSCYGSDYGYVQRKNSDLLSMDRVETEFHIGDCPVTRMTLLLHLVSRKLSKSINLPCHVCDGGITDIVYSHEIKNAGKNESKNTITIHCHYLKAHNALHVRQYARARLCKELFCDDDER